MILMEEKQRAGREKRGYLNEDFLLFHLKDSKGERYEYHYHDFYKVILFISGKVTYLIEGNAYGLRPWDILLVTNGDIHKAVIETAEPYERIVLWFNPDFLESHSTQDSRLLDCFDASSRERRHLLRPGPEAMAAIKDRLRELEKAFRNRSFGTGTEKSSLFLLFMVQLNRAFFHAENASDAYGAQYDETISKIISHIGANLGGDLSIESISDKFYLSRYALMHKFKKQTGFTIHSFILQKRLMKAGVCLDSGRSATDTSLECGFADYSSFVRAFKKFYGASPRQYAGKKARNV